MLAVALLSPGPHAQAGEDAAVRSVPARRHRAVEIEPHLVLGAAPPGFGQGSGGGAGVRASIGILPGGLLPNVDDSVALGVGLDYAHYDGKLALTGYHDRCLQNQPGPNGTQICTDITSNGGTWNYIYIPVVVQWNLWLTTRFSAFAEPGVDFYHLPDHGFSLVPALYVGGRLHLSNHVALTARLGYPTTLAVGLSLLL